MLAWYWIKSPDLICLNCKYLVKANLILSPVILVKYLPNLVKALGFQDLIEVPTKLNQVVLDNFGVKDCKKHHMQVIDIKHAKMF